MLIKTNDSYFLRCLHYRITITILCIFYNLYQDGLVVQALLLEAVRARLVGSGGAHHADDQLHGCVVVRGVGDGAGLHQVTVTLIRPVLTLKLVTLL